LGTYIEANLLTKLKAPYRANFPRACTIIRTITHRNWHSHSRRFRHISFDSTHSKAFVESKTLSIHIAHEGVKAAVGKSQSIPVIRGGVVPVEAADRYLGVPPAGDLNPEILEPNRIRCYTPIFTQAGMQMIRIVLSPPFIKDNTASRDT